MEQKTLFGHPAGLFILFFTELWERFSFYGMRAILVLYLTAETLGENPGLGWSNTEALELYGWYGMLVYMMSIPGGLMADRWLGQKKSVLVGGVLIILGQFTLAIDLFVCLLHRIGAYHLWCGRIKTQHQHHGRWII